MSNNNISIKVPILKNNYGTWKNNIYNTENISINGNWIAIKEPGLQTLDNPQSNVGSNNPRYIYLYKKDNNQWIYDSRIGLPWHTIGNWNAPKSISNYISMYNNYLVFTVDDFTFSINTHSGGTAFIYEKSSLHNNDWVRTAIVNSNSSNSFFNSSSINNNYVILGDSVNNSIYIVKRSDNSNIVSNNRYYNFWSKIQTITNTDFNGFGYNIVLKNNVVSIAYFNESFSIDDNKVHYNGGSCLYKKNDNDDNWNKITLYQDTSDNFFSDHILNESYFIISDLHTTNNFNGKFNIIDGDNSNLEWDNIVPILNNKSHNFYNFKENISTSGSHFNINDTISIDKGNTYIFNNDLQNDWNLSRDLSNDVVNQDYGWSVELKSNYLILGNIDNDIPDISANISTSNLLNMTLGKANTKISKEKLKEEFGIQEEVLNEMINTQVVSDSSGKKVAQVSDEVKNSIIKTTNGQKETKANISKKRKEFLNLVFSNNQDKQVVMRSEDIGLNETFKDSTSDRVIKPKIVVIDPVNITEPIDIAGGSDLDDDTGIYIELDQKNKPIQFNVGTSYPVTITKIQDASSNGDLELFNVNYKNIDYTREEGQQLSVGGATFYIGSVYLDNVTSGIPETGIFPLLFTKIRNDVHYLPDNINGTEAQYITTVTVSDKTSENIYYNMGDSKTFFLDSVEMPVLYLIAGKTYKFNTDDSSNIGYNFKFYSDLDKLYPYEFNVEYNGTPGNTSSFVKITPSVNTPGILYYQSESHSNMGTYFVVVSNNKNITSIPSKSKIHKIRHEVLSKIWENNPTKQTLITNTYDIALDRTIGKPIKRQAQVFKPNSLEVDLTNIELITKNKGVYIDLNELNDKTTVRTNSKLFIFKVVGINPKLYAIRNSDDTDYMSSVIYRDDQWVTIDNITFYFGGIFTNGTNDGITAADPYVFPINGNPYKLPDENANYCLFADENTFITGVVSQLSEEKQEEMRQWVIEKLGSDTNNGAELVTDGFFYSNVHVNTTVGELVLDMETKVCNTNNKDVFNVTFKNTRDNTELFKGEHKTTATISWNDNGNSMAVDVDFFENPQIRNGIRMNTVMTKSNPIGLLVEDYEPSLLCVENSKNKLSMYDTLLNVLGQGQRVEGEKLNLQKEGEVWTRHKM